VPSSAALFCPETARGRSIEARRAVRQKKFERERLIVDLLNRGLPVAEIAQRIGVTEKRMRALVRESLARRMPEPPEDYAALQISRLNEALAVAYSAMSPQNLKAVALVVRIVRELDRYHGFVGARPRRPEMAPQALENMGSELDEVALPHAPEAAPKASETACFVAEGVEAGASNDALPSARPPQCDSAAAAPPAPARKWRRKRLKSLITRPRVTTGSRGSPLHSSQPIASNAMLRPIGDMKRRLLLALAQARIR
jgi:hypothetical protein